MTPQEMNNQQVPQGATRHAMSVSLGMIKFYRDDVTPHQEWNGMCWTDLGLNGNCHPYTTPLSDKPYLHVPKTSQYYASRSFEIGSKFD